MGLACALLHDQIICVKCADYYAYAISWLYRSARIGKCHPVFPSLFRCAGLAKLADLFKGRNDELYPCVAINQIRFKAFIVDLFCFGCVQHVIAETDEFARLSAPDH